MRKVRMGILLFTAILMLQAPLSAGAGNISDGTGVPDGTEEQTEDAEGEGFPGDGAVPGDTVPGDITTPGGLIPGDTLSPGDLIPGDTLPPEDLNPEDMIPSEDMTEPGDTTLSEDTEGQEDVGSAFPEGMLTIVCVVCVVAAVVVVGIAVWAILLRKRNENVHRKPKDSRKTGAGIPVQLEVYAGKCRNRTPFLELSDSLTIGSSVECDIIFDDPKVAPLHSRIRLTGNQVYIEDLGSAVGTALDGMRIQGQNRLRGGEVISLGLVEFSILFLQDT